MTPLWMVLLAIAQALAWLSEPPKTLAAAAAREAIRRQIVGPSVGSYNNDHLDVDRDRAVVPAVAAPSGAQESIEAVESRDESWWRERVATIRGNITREEAQILALELEIPRLDGQAVSRDDPVQQASLRKQANEARAELETRRTDLAATRRMLAAVLEEARRLDVPPGWLR
jgi:hypothetical protein